MGVIWRIAMPLLSTLAALVIIVHSAEEDLDADYRYDLRPRALDTGTPSYDQPWRVVQSESMLHESTSPDWDIGTSDETPKRRRPGRKRKRRPIETSTEDDVQDKYTYPDETSPSNDETKYTNPYEVTDPPRRRRKKINTRSNRWADDNLDPEKPVRRRGYRRKRPTLETWPELAGYRAVSSSAEAEKLVSEKDMHMDSNVYNNEYRVSLVDKSKMEKDENREFNSDVSPAPENRAVLHVDTKDNEQKTQMQEDKSMSELSSETFSELQLKGENDIINIQKHFKEKSPTAENDLDKLQDSGPIDPQNLKDILKRSNGTSLSEILQQHNLSLGDLLHGKENVLSILKSTAPSSQIEKSRPVLNTESPLVTNEEIEQSLKILPSLNDQSENITINTHGATKNSMPKTDNNNSEDLTNLTSIYSKQETNIKENVRSKQNRTRFLNRRRFPPGIRKRLRMRPMLNNTLKGQLSRDMMAINVKRYYNRRNDTKSQRWKEILPLLKNVSIDNEIELNTENIETTTILITTEDITTILDTETYLSTVTDDINANVNDISQGSEISNIATTESNTPGTETTETVTEFNLTEKPLITSNIPVLNTPTIRRQTYNNILKKKRLKQKNSTAATPRENLVIIGSDNTMSASEFTAKTTSHPNTIDERQDFSTLEDFLTTEYSKNVESSTLHVPYLKRTFSNKPSTHRIPLLSTTEQTAKFEIEEILNDTRTSVKLSKILMERNMTINELVQHRERGSSHVHLADIFHNASREPNPPEPFLSKSLIEPISKETYPLRALLEANLHDPITKATTIDPLQLQNKYLNIPVVMDFGNNVNENAENMGIMSLFNNFTSTDTSTHKVLQKDSQGTLYESSVTNVNSTNINDREGRMLNDSQDLTSWKQIFAMIRKIGNNQTDKVIDTYAKELSPTENYKDILQEDLDGDGLIVLEDLQHLRDFDSNIAPDSIEKLQVNSYQGIDVPTNIGIFDKIPNSTKSVTVATLSIVGLATILFLLTYAAFKWRQQKKIHKKRSFSDERIPTPVFENRKGNKNNSSTRSISPMLSSSNIYTMNTIDSRNGKDSPEYMWDTLRKPFQ
ncbi:uncharacterized protein LOC131840976 [Achroia grisella]|uniref:uncharacterized protein LOC131840976 n=1 Tax=Achroia grisella TaxID=688607 RepID=UPI0027D22DB3|nr:uncharacterized protein LOC131840976 [Achroia grisella]